MSTISQMKTKLQSVLDTKLSIGEQSLTEDQQKKTLGNLGIWDKLVDYGNKLVDYGNKISSCRQNIESLFATKAETTAITELISKVDKLSVDLINLRATTPKSKSWNCMCRPSTWSRIAFITANNPTDGFTILINTRGTWNCCVYNGTFIYTGTHATGSKWFQVGATDYTQHKFRIIRSHSGEGFIELYVPSNNLGPSEFSTPIFLMDLGGVNWNSCIFYTKFTQSSIPDGYYSSEVSTVY